MPSAKKLLLVDDDVHAREGYLLYLSGAGFTVQALEGGFDALAVAQSTMPDLIVLDLGLPDLDGWEVARQLKADEQTKHIPIVAFSGRSMQHEQVSALRAGCDVYLTKPCEPSRLLVTIHKQLGIVPSGDDLAEPTDPY